MEFTHNIFWVGAVDWNVRSFHGHTYTTKRGTTYNAYLVIGEKVALIDTVRPYFADEMIQKIKEIVPLEDIDYVIANHVEMDHSGSLPEIMRCCPKAIIYGTGRCRDGLQKHYHGNWNFKVVKTGDTLNLGGRTLRFLEAAMLHWPDSMFTYLAEDRILFSNDGFGQHYATSCRFDDEVDQCALMDEAAKYYANILWPFSSLVVRKIEEIGTLHMPIGMIAPSHGIIWRKDPHMILNSYMKWGKNETVNKVVVVYETMWGSTDNMARKITQGLIDAGVNVRLYDIAQSDGSEVFKEMLDAKGFIIGSSTHDNNMLPMIASFMELLKGFKPKGRKACVFGSYGWGGGAIKAIEEILRKTGIEVVKEGLSVQYVPDEKALRRCYDYGKECARVVMI